jgi:anti-sigma factor RsiW
VAAPSRAAEAVRSCCDDEELAAFLDGRLDERERSQTMAHLAEEEDAYEVFACAAVIMADSDELLERMQTTEVRAATRRAFDASPDDLRKAAIEAARRSEG